MSAFGRRELVLQVPEKYWLLSNRDKFSFSPVLVHSGYMDCLLEFGELDFPLVLTVLIFEKPCLIL